MPGVRVELPAGVERDEVAAPLVVDEEHPVARRERALTSVLRSHRDRGAGRARFGSRQNAQHGRRASAHRTRLARAELGTFRCATALAGEALVGALEEAEHERRLRARRALLDRVQRLLVPEVPVADGHRALLDDVVDAGEHAVRRELALAQPNERLDLARESGRRRQHRMLAAEVLRVPPQHVAEQHRGFVVEVVTGREHVVAVRRARPR